MKKTNNYNLRIFAFLFITLLIMIVLFGYAITSMKKDYFEAIGRRAMSISIVMANELELSNAEVERLKALDFNELLEDSVNVEFEKFTRMFMEASEVKYIYLLHDLEDDEVKYHVEADEVEYYELEENTTLNTVYLIDSVINDLTRIEDTDGLGYTDKDRYTYLHEEIRTIMNLNKADYLFYRDEWGTYITGFAPVYSIEGDYIGILGSDIFLDEYMELIKRRAITLFLFCLIIIIMLVILVSESRKIDCIKSKVDDLEVRVYYDEMTGLFNRRTLNEREEEYSQIAREKNIPVAAIMFDIDMFKNINDTYGHLKGDEVIIAVAKIIKSIFTDKYHPYRYGGDEFLVLAFDVDKKAAENIANTILQEVRKLKIEGVNQGITLSIGIAIKHLDEKLGIIDLFMKADEMLYLSKQQGRNQINIIE